MTVFDGYYDDYEHARQEAVEAIDEYMHTSDPTARDQWAVTAKSHLDEVERYIRILENEAQTGSSLVEKRHLMAQVHHCRAKWTGLKTALDREMLVRDARGVALTEATTMEQLESCTERVDRTGRHLDDAQRTLVQTEAIAENVANNLLQQRNQLEHAELNITQTQDDTEEAKSHIRSMALKACTSRVLLFLVMLALVAAIVLVSYYKWYPRDRKDHLGILPSSNGSNSSSSATQ